MLSRVPSGPSLCVCRSYLEDLSLPYECVPACIISILLFDPLYLQKSLVLTTGNKLLNPTVLHSNSKHSINQNLWCSPPFLSERVILRTVRVSHQTGKSFEENRCLFTWKTFQVEETESEIIKWRKEVLLAKWQTWPRHPAREMGPFHEAKVPKWGGPMCCIF